MRALHEFWATGAPLRSSGTVCHGTVGAMMLGALARARIAMLSSGHDARWFCLVFGPCSGPCIGLGAAAGQPDAGSGAALAQAARTRIVSRHAGLSRIWPGLFPPAGKQHLRQDQRVRPWRGQGPRSPQRGVYPRSPIRWVNPHPARRSRRSQAGSRVIHGQWPIPRRGRSQRPAPRRRALTGTMLTRHRPCGSA